MVQLKYICRSLTKGDIEENERDGSNPGPREESSSG